MNQNVHIVKPHASLIEGITPYQRIELAGRNCYQSDSEFTEETAIKFVQQMMQRGHGAMLEHGIFVFKIVVPVEDMETMAHAYSALRSVKFANCHSYVEDGFCICYAAISLRTLLDNALFLSQMQITASFGEIVEKAYPGIPICDWTPFQRGTDTGNAEVTLMAQEEMYEGLPTAAILNCVSLSIRYITDRGVSHELVRHRVASFAQESTRYCNYSKDKYNGRVQFIEPAGFDTWTCQQKEAFIDALAFAEKQYLAALERGLKAQQARAILPNATKTDIVVTMNVEELIHFFNLRYHGTTGAPHPDMLEITKQSFPIVIEELSKYKHIGDIISTLRREEE